MTFKGKLFYHNHVDVGDFFYDPDLTQEIARSTYKDNMEGGSLLGEYNLLPIDTLRAAFNYRRDEHQEQAAIGVPYLESVSYTGSVSVENQFDPIKPLSIVAGVAYDWWNVASRGSNKVRARRPAPTGLTLWSAPPIPCQTPPSSSLPGRGRSRFPTLNQLYSSKGGNPDLMPEHSDNYVLGASRGITQYAKAETSFFVHDVTDMINRNAPEPSGALS